MRTIILEGVSASGKTTIAKHLIYLANEKKLTCHFVEESKTIMPILKNTDRKTSLEHIHKVLDQAYNQNDDLIIFDRLHLTPIAITKSTVTDFESVEKILLQKNTMLVFLQMDEQIILDRVLDSIIYRSPSWEAHVRSKGSDELIAKHYQEAQRKLQALIGQTRLAVKKIDTTMPDYKNLAQEIIDELDF